MLCGQVRRGLHVLAREHEDVRGRLRVDVANRKHVAVVADDGRGHVVRGDLAEEAVVVHGASSVARR